MNRKKVEQAPLFAEPKVDEVNVTEEPPFQQDEPAPVSGEPIALPETIAKEANEYGIDALKAKNLVGNLPQITAERDILSKQYDEIIKMDVEDPKTAKLAKELRIKIRDNRTKGIQIWHKTTKDYFLKGGQFVDAIKAKEVVINERMEENLETIEKHAEIKRQKEEQELRDKRVAELEPYREFVPMGIDLGKIDDAEYAKVFNGAKLQHEFKLDQERKAEEQRKKLEEERIERENRKQKLLPYQKYIDGFADLDFFNMTQEECDALLEQGEANFQKAKQEYEENKKKLDEANRLKAIREARTQELMPYVVFIRDFNGMLDMEEELYQKEFADIRKGAELQWQHDAEKLKKEQQEKEEADRKAAELEKENEQLQKQLKEKEEADKKAQAEKEKAERKLKNASDKVKLLDLADKILVFKCSFPEVSGNEAKEIVKEAESYFTRMADYVKNQAKSLEE